jgi:hypothetical protein
MTDFAAVVPNTTADVGVKPVPVIATTVLPASGPAAGLIDATVGTASYVNLSAADAVLTPFVVVTRTSTVPAVPEGAVHVMVDPFTTTTFVAGFAPNATVAPVTKFVPVIVTDVPPATGPAVGLTALTDGTGMNVNLSNADVGLVPPELVTVTSTIPLDSAGDLAEIDVGLVYTTDVPATEPKLTVEAAVNPVPVILTVVPPTVGPLVGLIKETVGVASYVNLSAATVPLVPPAVVTVISTVPALSAGDTAVIDVALLTVKLVAAVLPNVTPVAAVKPVPVMVTDVPPARGPAPGAIAETTGTGSYVNWSAAVLLLVPSGVVTVICTAPAASAGDVAVSVVSLTTVNDDAAIVPKLTFVAPVKPEPVTVTTVLPVRGPAVGLIEETLGGVK